MLEIPPPNISDSRFPIDTLFEKPKSEPPPSELVLRLPMLRTIPPSTKRFYTTPNHRVDIYRCLYCRGHNHRRRRCWSRIRHQPTFPVSSLFSIPDAVLAEHFFDGLKHRQCAHSRTLICSFQPILDWTVLPPKLEVAFISTTPFDSTTLTRPVPL